MNIQRCIEENPEFLFCCVSTYSWDILIQCCHYLEHGLTPERRKILTRTDQWGNTVLHAACYNRPPLAVVQSLLAASKAHVYELHLQQARDGSTPLQVACACGASVSVIQSLLAANAHTPREGASVVCHADQMGGTPLSDLVIQYSLERQIRSHIKLSWPLDQINSIAHVSSCSDLFRSFWAKCRLLLYAAVSSEYTSETRVPLSIIEQAAYLAESCPPVLTDLIFRCCFDHVHDHAELLQSILSRWSRRHRQQSWHPMSLQRRDYFIQNLLRAYPDSVSLAKRTTLCLALEAGLHWHSDPKGTTGLLQTIWRLRPKQLTVPDVADNLGLYPFCVPAIAPTSSSLISSDIQDLSTLDTIYCLLRLKPDVISLQSLEIYSTTC